MIRGQVVDQTHAAVPGVEITVVNTVTGLRRGIPTDSSGNFSLAGLHRNYQ
jgi:carboxypeptidase family protein